MNEIFKKFNVFDYFSHLVPGAIVVLALLLCHYNSCCDCAKCLCLKSFNFNSFSTLSDKLIEDNTIAFWTFFLVASHCIGLVNNVISDFVWYGFRNNTILIGIAKKHIDHNSLSICENLLFIAVSITLALILFIVPRTTINKIVSWFEKICAKMKNITWFEKICAMMKRIILGFKKIYDKIKNIALFGKICAMMKRIILGFIRMIFYILGVCYLKMKNIILWFISPCITIEDYYKKYEEVKVHYPSNNISNLEAQIAFLRNSILPLFLLSLICIDKSNPNILLIVSPFIAFAAFFLHQQKLYFHVYELCHIIDLKNMKLKLMVLAKKKADDNKTDIVSLFSQNLKDANCAEMCYGELDGIGVGVISLEDIADASCDTIKEKIEIFKNARALVVICREGENDLYDKIKKYAKTSFFDLKEIVFEDEEANSVDRVESIIKKFFK
ncbi:MAG: hypothetical protein UF067_00760 [Paludibacteraceae bacterium]|nr:hypothetical protein [Paludibacteraceae bacterium]